MIISTYLTVPEFLQTYPSYVHLYDNNTLSLKDGTIWYVLALKTTPSIRINNEVSTTPQELFHPANNEDAVIIRPAAATEWAYTTYGNADQEDLPVWERPRAPFVDRSRHEQHYVLRSKEDPTKVSYFRNREDMCRDRRTRTTPGRYLQNYYGDVLSPREIAFWGTWQSSGVKPEEVSDLDFLCPFKSAAQLEFADTPDDIVEVYTEGPQSCMAGRVGQYNSGVHPTHVYGAGDLAVAYVRDPKTQNIVARALCWPEKKIYGRVYAVEGYVKSIPDYFKALLAKEGYSDGSHLDKPFNDARLLKILVPNLFPPPVREGLVVPYLDWNYGVYDSGDGFLRMRHNSEPSVGKALVVQGQSTSGTVHAQLTPFSECYICESAIRSSREAYATYVSTQTNTENRRFTCGACCNDRSKVYHCEGYNARFDAKRVPSAEVANTTRSYSQQYVETRFKQDHFTKKFLHPVHSRPYYALTIPGNAQEAYTQHANLFGATRKAFFCRMTGKVYPIEHKHAKESVLNSLSESDVQAWVERGRPHMWLPEDLRESHELVNFMPKTPGVDNRPILSRPVTDAFVVESDPEVSRIIGWVREKPTQKMRDRLKELMSVRIGDILYYEHSNYPILVDDLRMSFASNDKNFDDPYNRMAINLDSHFPDSVKIAYSINANYDVGRVGDLVTLSAERVNSHRLTTNRARIVAVHASPELVIDIETTNREGNTLSLRFAKRRNEYQLVNPQVRTPAPETVAAIPTGTHVRVTATAQVLESFGFHAKRGWKGEILSTPFADDLNPGNKVYYTVRVSDRSGKNSFTGYLYAEYFSVCSDAEAEDGHPIPEEAVVDEAKFEQLCVAYGGAAPLHIPEEYYYPTPQQYTANRTYAAVPQSAVTEALVRNQQAASFDPVLYRQTLEDYPGVYVASALEEAMRPSNRWATEQEVYTSSLAQISTQALSAQAFSARVAAGDIRWVTVDTTADQQPDEEF